MDSIDTVLGKEILHKMDLFTQEEQNKMRVLKSAKVVDDKIL